MKTLKTTLFATLAMATAAAAIAGSAAAQPYDHRDNGRYEERGRWDNDRRGDDGYNINGRQAQIEQRIEWGARRGVLNRRETVSLRTESRDIARLEAQYRPGGLNPAERRALDRRLDRLETQLAHDLRDRDYGYNDRR